MDRAFASNAGQPLFAPDRLRKYAQVAKITWKSMLVYQADTWLGAAVSGFRVLLAFMLWQAIFNGRQEVAGYTLPAMITYALVAAMLARLQHQDATGWQISHEVREGQFSKYLAHPVSVMAYFLWVGIGRWSYLLLVNSAALVVWAAAFSPWLALPADPRMLLWLLVLLPLGALVMLLFIQDIGLLSLKFQDVTGMMIMKGVLVEFFSGAMVPLNMLPAGVVSVIRLTPFYYVVYYPASLVVGRQSDSPWLAVLVLLVWCGLFYAFGQVWFRRARRHYEGVGI